MKKDILNAKRKLYWLLLEIDEDKITDNELDIMYSLSKDEQIQALLKNKKDDCFNEQTPEGVLKTIEKGTVEENKLGRILAMAKQMEKEQDFMVGQDDYDYKLGVLRGIQRIVGLIERNM